MIIFLANIQCQQFQGFDRIEKKDTLYRREGCIKKFCGSLREHAKNKIDLEKKKILSLTKEEAKVSYICGKRILQKLAK